MLVLVGATVRLVQGGAGRLRARQDKQYLVGFAQLPDGATLDRTEDVIRQMSDIALEAAGRRDAVAFPGLSINGFTNSSNAGIVFVDAQAVRRAHDARAAAAARSRSSSTRNIAAIKDAFIAVFPPPPVQGLGTIGGFKLQIEDRAGLGYEALDEATKAFMAKAATDAGTRRRCSPATRSTCRSSMPTSTAPRRASSACR